MRNPVKNQHRSVVQGMQDRLVALINQSQSESRHERTELVRTFRNEGGIYSPRNYIRPEEVDRWIDDYISLSSTTVPDLESLVVGDCASVMMVDDVDPLLHMVDSSMLCPLCSGGYLALPMPGVLVCDNCSDMRLSLPSESLELGDIAERFDCLLRYHIRHGTCTFRLSEGRTGLIFHCPVCGPIDVFS
jgi:hypothetical protein